jgi:hypothetical protein
MPGVNRAWVHSEDFLLAGGSWTHSAMRVFSARFDSTENQTQLTGEGLSWEAFLTTRQQAQQ